jgi:hypothetical protein
VRDPDPDIVLDQQVVRPRPGEEAVEPADDRRLPQRDVLAVDREDGGVGAAQERQVLHHDPLIVIEAQAVHAVEEIGTCSEPCSSAPKIVDTIFG